MPRTAATLVLSLMAGLLLPIALAAPAAADKLDAIKARGKLLVGVTESFAAVFLPRRRQRHRRL